MRQINDTEDLKMAARDMWGKFFGRLAIVLVVLVFLSIISLIVFRIGWVDFIDNYELAYKFDVRSGDIEILKKTGYIVTPPIVVKVHAVDMRPMQVCINANSRVLNCKLVKFNPDGLETFLSWHGRNDYSGQSVGTLSEILKSYAYDGSGRTYPFLTVVRELKPEEVQEVAKK